MVEKLLPLQALGFEVHDFADGHPMAEISLNERWHVAVTWDPFFSEFAGGPAYWVAQLYWVDHCVVLSGQDTPEEALALLKRKSDTAFLAGLPKPDWGSL